MYVTFRQLVTLASVRTMQLLLSFFLVSLVLLLFVSYAGGKANTTESIETDTETSKHDDDEVGSSHDLKEILRNNIRNSLGKPLCILLSSYQ